MRALFPWFLLFSVTPAFGLCEAAFARLFGDRQFTPEYRQALKVECPVIGDLSVPVSGKKLLVELPGDGHLIYGTGELVPVGPDRQLLLLKDSRGAKHLIDPMLEGIVIRDATSLSGETLAKAKQLRKKSGTHLNEKDLKERFCKGFGGAMGKLSDKGSKAIDSLLAKTNKTRLMLELSKTCALSATAISSFDQVGDALFFDDERSTFYAAHRSNFNWGVAGMVVFHNCLSVVSPAHSKLLLTLGLGAYVAGNTYFELGLGQPNLDGKTPIKTDPGDFATGTAGFLLYALYGRMIERRLGTNFRTFCK